MKRLIATLLLALTLAALTQASSAQVSGLTWKGPVTAGHCTLWEKPGVVEDSGVSGCGSGGAALPTCTLDQMIYYAAAGDVGTCLTLGTNLSISGGTLNASGGGGSPGGSSGQIQYNNGGSFGGFTLGGDCTFSEPNITCTKTSGTAFTVLATETPGGGVQTALGLAVDTNGGMALYGNEVTFSGIDNTPIGASTAAAGTFTTLAAISLGLTDPLTVANGGLGLTSITQYDMLLGNGTSAPTLVAPGTATYVWTSNGSGAAPTWQAVSASASSITPGTTTINGATSPCMIANSSGTVMQCATLSQTLALSSGVLGETAPTRTVTSSPTVASTDMGGLINSNVSGGGTLTIPAISSSIFASGMTLTVVNYSASTEAVSTTPTVNSGGGCVSGTGIPSGDAWWMTSNGTTIDCIQTISTGGGGSGTVTTTGSPASTYLAGFSGSTSITGTANATLSGGALTLGVSGTLGSIQLGNATSGTVTLEPVTGALGTVTASLPANTGTIAELNLSQTFTGTNTFGGVRINGTPQASAALLNMSTGVYTAGTGTTNWPAFYMDPGATGPTTFSTAGTFFGINAASGFTGNLEQYYVNGGSAVYTLTYQGNITAGTYNGVTIPATSSTALTSPTTTTAGQCQESTTTAGLGQWVTCSGGGTVTTTGSPASGELTEFSGSTSITNGNLSGDVTTSGTLAATVVAIKGIAVAVATASSSTSVTPNCTNAFTKVTASATGTFTINAPGTCTPFDGQKLELKIISPSGGTITYSWNATYIASATLALPTTSNAASKEDYFEFQYDTDKSGWVFLADNQGF
jgi:hypothetical protein